MPACGKDWPAALPQALIAGKPVVSYDIDGAREVAINGETGFLVPPRWDGTGEPLINSPAIPSFGTARECRPRAFHRPVSPRVHDPPDSRYERC